MNLLDRIVNPLVEKEVNRRMTALLEEAAKHNSAIVGSPTSWSWQSTMPDSYYPNAILRDGSRTISGNLSADAGVRVNIDEIRARSASGLKLFDDGGVGIFVEDGGNVGIGTTNPAVAGLVVDKSVNNKIARFKSNNAEWSFFYVDSVAGSNAGFSLFENGAQKWGVYNKASNDSFIFGEGATMTPRLVLLTGGNVGFGTTSPDRRIHSEHLSALTNTVQQVARLTHITSGTPANGIGVGMEFEQETSSGNNEVIAILEAVMTDVTVGSEDADFVVKTMSGGSAAAERLRVTSDGYIRPYNGYKAGDSGIMFDHHGWQQSGAKTRDTRAFGHNAEISVTGGNTSTTVEAETVNGVLNGQGYRIPRAGKVTAVTIQCNVTSAHSGGTIPARVAARLYVNGAFVSAGEAHFTPDTVTDNAGAVDTVVEHDFSAGDRIGARTYVSTGSDTCTITVDDIAILVEVET